jgi:hypothetical protein
MRDNGWYDKPGVKILEGKWQEFVGSDKMEEFGGFDAVYTDTFSEDYDGWLAFRTGSTSINRGSQISTNSSSTSRDSSLDLNQDLVSSTGLVPRASSFPY